MNYWLQTAANIATVVSVIWTLFFGGKLLREILRNMRNRAHFNLKASTVTNILLAIIVIVLVAPYTHWVASFPFMSTSTVGAQHSNLPSTVYFPYDKTLVLNDSLIGDLSTHHWEDDADQHGACQPTTGAYVAVAQKGFFTTCTAASTNFSNFTYQVRLTILEGDKGGIIFRSNGTNFYYFYIGSDGSYRLNIASGNAFAGMLKTGFSSAINLGLNQSNQIGVIARGSNLELYINGEYITNAHDDTYTSGQIGVISVSTYVLTKVAFTQAQIWTW